MAKTPELQRFYASQKWQALRHRLVVESGGVCASCGQIIPDTSDLIVHHKIELTLENYKNPDISLNPTNLEVLCWTCHSRHHAAERDPMHVRKQVYLVWGSPCSGKSTYVREQAGPDDLIVDLDLIYSSLSFQPIHIHPRSIQSVVFGTRDYILEQIRIRNGRWATAWIIGGYPRQREREDLLCRLRADDIFIQASRQECEARARERDPLCQDEILRAIADWWQAAQGVPSEAGGEPGCS